MDEKVAEKRGMINWKSLILSFILVSSVAAFGNFFIQKGITSFWYLTIKPAIIPPDWVFMVAWNIIFFLIALSLYFSMSSAEDEKSRLRIEIVFGINFILNALWSLLYFSLRKPLYAFIDISLLWVSIFLMIFVTWKIDKKASLILIPYLLWISFAVFLNYLTMFK